MAKFPVTLYTASKCDACEMGRALLQRRGIPFAERTANTNEDKEVWEKVTGGQEAPVMKVGAQVLRGFTASAWEETLDVAGYSRQSQLPPNYKAAAAQPLVEPKPSPAAGDRARNHAHAGAGRSAIKPGRHPLLTLFWR